MRKGLLLGGIFCTLLFTASPALAVITAALENPVQQGPVSGFALVSGWAFAIVDDAPVDVTIQPIIDGVVQEDVEILCCFPRADVQAANPGAPLATGFANGIQYGELSAGPHTIGMMITAPDSEPVTINHAVQVVKPGGASFVTGMDFTGAMCTPEESQIACSDVTVSSAAGDVIDDITTAYSTASQSTNIVDSTVGGGDTAQSFVANLNVSQEIPPSMGSTASGSAFLSLNEDMTLTYRVVVPPEGLTSNLMPLGPEGLASAAHIHQAAPGVAGGIIIFLTFVEDSGDPAFLWEGTSDPLTAEQSNALFNGELYVNVHTEVNQSGEIRGQIVSATGPGPCADSTRDFFVEAAPGSPGSVTPTPNQGCRLLGETFCEMGWQYIMGDPAAGPASCTFFPDFGECAACGPNNEAAEVCTNTCS